MICIRNWLTRYWSRGIRAASPLLDLDVHEVMGSLAIRLVAEQKPEQSAGMADKVAGFTTPCEVVAEDVASAESGSVEKNSIQIG